MNALYDFTERVRGKSLREAIQRAPLVKDFLPSFCETASRGFRYRFYLAHDFDDTVFSNEEKREEFSDIFALVVSKTCQQRTITVELMYVNCSHKGILNTGIRILA